MAATSQAAWSVRDPDSRLRWTLRLLALPPLLLVLGLGWQLWTASRISRHAFGWSFATASAWDPVAGKFGAWPFLYGTLLTTALAILLAAPLGVATAVFLAELSPRRLRRPLAGMVELLAAVPSVVYGLWGIFVLAPWLQRSVEPWLSRHAGAVPLFQGAPYGVGYLAAGLILAIMIVPYVVNMAREALAAVPRHQAEAAYALGATRWEIIGRVLLPTARSGIWGGVLLGTGRALGETMAVTMVIGNRRSVSASLFAPGYTLASAIANEFTEATTPLYTSALVELGLVLFAITLLANGGALLLRQIRARSTA
ncbi:MAG TPA: phosphate ABC transporter permease subunit PstC [Terriglobales bacterium]|nr:phosphate ABC transporter permease subunit PstC [Terriglobales bacterium]